jgi:thymidylate synthase ThyX
MFPYVPERFTPAEEAVLRRHVTNTSGPVFALVNLPEVVKGALFARYSRSSKSLRRLLLDEFLGDGDATTRHGDGVLWAGDEARGPEWNHSVDGPGRERADRLYARVLDEYGDDSVAQLGGAHLACEQVSNLLTKLIERGRLMAYLEQSTRYVAYDDRLPNGHYRYYRDPEILDSPLGARYVGELDRIFDAYGALLPRLRSHLARRFPCALGESEVAWRRAIHAKALDALRGLLPAASLSNVGVFGSGQAFEQLVLRLRADPLPEARRYAELMLDELRQVIPEFLRRLDDPARGPAWVRYLQETRHRVQEVAARLWPEGAEPSGPAPASVRLVDFDPAGEQKVLAAILVEAGHGDEHAAREVVRRLAPGEQRTLLDAYAGDRRNRRHRPGRAFEATTYRFEIVSDYGAFRDLQRHRMLTITWQPLSPALGYDVPEPVEEAGLAEDYVAALERSRQLYEALVERFEPARAAYAVSLAYRVRYVLQMNAREAMHLAELRSSRQGHPSYRRIAHEIHRQIAEVAGHRAIADAMRFVDYGEDPLERLPGELRRAERIAART